MKDRGSGKKRDDLIVVLHHVHPTGTLINNFRPSKILTSFVINIYVTLFTTFGPDTTTLSYIFYSSDPLMKQRKFDLKLVMF